MDLAPGDHGFFSPHGLVTTEIEEVEMEFLEYWHAYLPEARHIHFLEKNTIGACPHLFPMIIPYDDTFQRMICSKI